MLSSPSPPHPHTLVHLLGLWKRKHGRTRIVTWRRASIHTQAGRGICACTRRGRRVCVAGQPPASARVCVCVSVLLRAARLPSSVRLRHAHKALGCLPILLTNSIHVCLSISAPIQAYFVFVFSSCTREQTNLIVSFSLFFLLLPIQYSVGNTHSHSHAPPPPCRASVRVCVGGCRIHTRASEKRRAASRLYQKTFKTENVQHCVCFY